MPEDFAFDFDDDFFDQLDEDLAAAASNEPGNTGDDDNSANEGEEPTSVEELKKELNRLKKRYGDSSREAKRLYNELQEIKSAVESIKSNPEATLQAKQILESSAPEDIKKAIGLPEDFVFDFDEALSNPRSDSAKALHAMVDALVTERVDRITTEKQMQEKIRDELEAFKKKMNLNDEELGELIEWSKSHVLSIEDVWYLKNRKQREREIAKRAVEEFKRQLSKMGNVPNALAGVGHNDSTSADESKAVFDLIKQSLGYSG